MAKQDLLGFPFVFLFCLKGRTFFYLFKTIFTYVIARCFLC